MEAQYHAWQKIVAVANVGEGLGNLKGLKPWWTAWGDVLASSS
jgi:hypothetical protein